MLCDDEDKTRHFHDVSANASVQFRCRSLLLAIAGQLGSRVRGRNF